MQKLDITITGNIHETLQQSVEEAVRNELKSRGAQLPLTGKEAAQLRALGVDTSKMCVALTEEEEAQFLALGVTVRRSPALNTRVQCGPGTPIKFLAARSSPFRSR